MADQRVGQQTAGLIPAKKGDAIKIYINLNSL